jgi:NAD-specific glutamate dehydrogenase
MMPRREAGELDARRFMRALDAKGRLDRAVEFLPDDPGDRAERPPSGAA